MIWWDSCETHNINVKREGELNFNDFHSYFVSWEVAKNHCVQKERKFFQRIQTSKPSVSLSPVQVLYHPLQTTYIPKLVKPT